MYPTIETFSAISALLPEPFRLSDAQGGRINACFNAATRQDLSRLRTLRQLEPPIGNSLKPIEEANRNSRASSSGPRSALLDGGAGLAKASQTLSDRAHCRTLH